MKEKEELLVTFVVIAYNAEKFLQKCLNSLKAQKYNHKNIEVILVDSNSNDNTRNVMINFKNIEKGFKEIKVLDNPKKVLPAGWNIALKEASGETILRVDAHSTFPDDFILNNVKEINNGEDIVGGHRISMSTNDSAWQKTLLIAEESLFGSGIATYRRKNDRRYVSTLAHAMYRKKVFDDVGPYNEELARTEDNEMHYRMKQAGYKFLLSPEIVSYHHARNTLRGMLKQKYSNGKWIGITLKYCPKCFSIYHFVPLVFVIGIIFSLIMTYLKNPIFIYLLLGSYLIFNIINLIFVFFKYKFNIFYFILPFILFLMHISYGVGTIIGVIKGMFIKNRKKLKNEKK